MIVCGIDLAGPANLRDTAVASFAVSGGTAVLLEARRGLDDAALLAHATGLVQRDRELFVGLDAPLSYNPGGGDRPADRALRQALRAAGLSPGTVMPPTMTRMVYLTLRGISVARLLGTILPVTHIAEVHPAGALVLHGASPADVRALKREEASRRRLLDWLEGQGLVGAGDLPADSDHLIAACAAVLGTWRWADGHSAWLAPPQPPLHPFAYIC